MRTYLLGAIALLVVALVPTRTEPPRPGVGSKKFTESVILGEVLRLLAEEKNVGLNHAAELGGTQILFQALKRGEIVAYVEYTGTIDEEILAGQVIESDADRAEALAEAGIRILTPLGFDNTYALAMRRQRAEALGILRISDLATEPALKFGLSNEFLDRKDGWPGLRAHYRLPSQNVFGTDHDLAYRQLQSGEIDAIDAYTTDARIDAQDLVLLEDDKNYFPNYAAVVLASKDYLRRHPDVEEAWRQLDGRILEPTMRAMNAAVEIDGQSETSAAADFVQREFQIEIRPSQESRGSRVRRHLWDHLNLIRRSLLPAIVVAIPLGILAAKSRWFGQIVLAATGVVQTIPALALLVLLIPVAHALGAASIGRGSGTAIMALFLYSLLPIVRNTCAGLKDIPTSLRESAEVLGLSRTWQLSHVELPLATRSILAGVKTATVLNIGYATLGALIGAGGFGQPILTGIRLNRLDLIMEGAIPAALLALVAQGVFECVERWAIPRGLR